jgi:hypothetical protein
MSYAILRIAKLTNKTGRNSLLGSAKHNFREQETFNADPSKTSNNITHGSQNSKELLKALNNRLDTVETVRKNAVLAVEYFIGMSPQFSGDIKEYFNEAERWLKEKNGIENVLSVTHHYDETTPHICAYVVPIDDKGKLNARSFFGGSKKLSDLQTDFADSVSKLGLQRGIKGSKARHTDIKKYYSLINSIVNNDPVIDIPKPKLLENKKEFGDRVAKEVIEKVSDEIKKLKIELQINKETEIKRLSKINLKVYKEDKVYIKNFEKVTAENYIYTPKKSILNLNEEMIPRSLINKYEIVLENNIRKFYNKQDGKLNFFDDGEKIYTDVNDKDVVNDMVRLAKTKNWIDVYAIGSNDFKHEFFLNAEQLGLKLKNTSPQFKEISNYADKSEKIVKKQSSLDDFIDF